MFHNMSKDKLVRNVCDITFGWLKGPFEDLICNHCNPTWQVLQSENDVKEQEAGAEVG